MRGLETEAIHAFNTKQPVSHTWKPLKGLKAVSLFAGAGGLDLGFIKAGHKVIWANDFDPDSADTYRHNIGKHIVCGDVSEIQLSDVPNGDIILAGLPCQGFSRANVHRAKRDARNRLYMELLRFLDGKQPRFFVVENVRGMLSLNGGATFRSMLSAYRKCGYEVEYKVLNAADYGVPQNRVRVFIIGIRSDVSDKYRYEFPLPTHFRSPTTSGDTKWVSIGEALRGIPDPASQHTLKNHVYSSYKVTNRDFTGHRATDVNKPSPTILARGNGGGGVCAIPHPNNNRRLSVRESALVQTFPIDFEFKGKLNSMYRQIGNAVPVHLARAIASGFYKRD